MSAPGDRRARVVVIDNYDSFTFNLVHALSRGGADCTVIANDAASAADVLALRPDGIVISAGPCTPRESGVSMDVVAALLADAGPALLGVCLGHQCIAAALGAQVVRSSRPTHGKTARVRHDGRGLFAGMEQPVEVARYNSLVVRELAAELEPCAWDEQGELMALRHRGRPIEGVQFHPESHLCPGAEPLLWSWVSRCLRGSGE